MWSSYLTTTAFSMDPYRASRHYAQGGEPVQLGVRACGYEDYPAVRAYIRIAQRVYNRPEFILCLLQQSPLVWEACGHAGGWPKSVHMLSVTSGESVARSCRRFFNRLLVQTEDFAQEPSASLVPSYRRLCKHLTLSCQTHGIAFRPQSPFFLHAPYRGQVSLPQNLLISKSFFMELLPLSRSDQMNSSSSSIAFSSAIQTPFPLPTRWGGLGWGVFRALRRASLR